MSTGAEPEASGAGSGVLVLAGTPLGVLRRVVTLESAVPLLVVAALSIAVGFGGAELFLRAQLGYTLRPPGVGYYGIVVAGLVAALAIIAATLPLLTERLLSRNVSGEDIEKILGGNFMRVFESIEAGRLSPV